MSCLKISTFILASICNFTATPSISAMSADVSAAITTGEALQAQTQRERLYLDLMRLPLSFEPNQGQADKEIKYLSRSRHYGIAITAREVMLKLRQSKSVEKFESTVATTNLVLKFVGANPKAQISTSDKLPGKVHYLSGRDLKKNPCGYPNFCQGVF